MGADRTKFLLPNAHTVLVRPLQINPQVILIKVADRLHTSIVWGYGKQGT